MTRDEIETVVIEILKHDGPDGHIDGYDVIAAFIEAVRDGWGPAWFHQYRRDLDERARA